jgi:hypothetical protein
VVCLDRLVNSSEATEHGPEDEPGSQVVARPAPCCPGERLREGRCASDPPAGPWWASSQRLDMKHRVIEQEAKTITVTLAEMHHLLGKPEGVLT